MYYSTSSTNEKIQLVIDAGLLPSVCNYCGSQSNKENYVAVKILGNVLSGNENQAQMAIDIGSMDKLAHSISSNDALIRREGYWALSNLVAGTVTQLHVFLNNNIKNLAFNGIKDLDLQVKYEASVMVANICLRADHTIAYDMVKLGLLVFLKENLTKLTQEKILINLLRISDGLLKAQKSFNEAGNDMVNLFDSSGCLDQLLSLENHSSSKILSKVHEILQKHFKIEDDKEIRPQVTAMFDFS